MLPQCSNGFMALSYLPVYDSCLASAFYQLLELKQSLIMQHSTTLQSLNLDLSLHFLNKST